VIAALAGAFGTFDVEHVELARDIAEDTCVANEVLTAGWKLSANVLCCAIGGMGEKK
jgi:hypothetical protein